MECFLVAKTKCVYDKYCLLKAFMKQIINNGSCYDSYLNMLLPLLHKIRQASYGKLRANEAKRKSPLAQSFATFVHTITKAVFQKWNNFSET